MGYGNDNYYWKDTLRAAQKKVRELEPLHKLVTSPYFRNIRAVPGEYSVLLVDGVDATSVTGEDLPDVVERALAVIKEGF